MHKLNQEFLNDEEPQRPTPCLSDPDRWHPDEQQPDTGAVAACWSCHFQSRCARRALNVRAEFGIWAGYRLAPGPGLARSHQQLRFVAGLEVGPPGSPGAAVSLELDRQAQTRTGADHTTAAATTAPIKRQHRQRLRPLQRPTPAPTETALPAHHTTPRYCRPRPAARVANRVPAQAG